MKILTKDYIPIKIIPRYRNIKRELNIKEYKSYYILSAKRCRKEIKIPRIINLNDEDLIAIGLYLAEGKKEKPHKNKKSNHNGEVCFDSSDLKSLNLICNLFKKFGIKREEIRTNLDLNINYKDIPNEDKLSDYWINELKLNPKMKRKKWFRYKGIKGGRLSKNTSPKGCLRLAYSSVILRNIFIPFVEDFFKHVISEENKIAISLILKGYFAGDGHVSYSENHKRKQLEFLCNDYVLRNRLRKGLNIIGVSNIKETNPVLTKTHTYALRIYNKPDFLKLNEYKIPYLMDYKKETFIGLLNQYKK